MKKTVSIGLVLVLITVTVLASVPLLSDSDLQPQGLSKLNILKGTGQGLALERPVTRAEAVTLISRLYPYALPDGENPFADMEGHWAKEAVASAAAAGWVHGCTETTFEPERTVTGPEFLKMLLLMLGYENVTTENAHSLKNEARLSYPSALVTENKALTRSDTVRFCYDALTGKLAGGGLLKQALVEQGKYKEEDFAFMGDGSPAAEDLSFADRLNRYMPTDENYVFSPYSAQVAFAMAANGADGETKAEMLKALGISDLDSFNETARQTIAAYKNSESLTIESANAIWLNTDRFPGAFSDSFSKLIADYYDGTAKTVTDDTAVSQINSWANEKTRGKIPQVIATNEFDALLANAVYFKGSWMNEFSENATEKKAFYSRSGSEKEIDFMQRTARFSYAKTDSGIQILEMPYMKDFEAETPLNISMYLLMGDGRVENPVKTLENAEFSSKKIQLALPKFKIETDLPLKKIMMDMGMTTAFDSVKADMPYMLTQNAYLIDALQKAYIAVDEKGTEAAAVTVIMAGATAAPAPEEIIELTFDKPFTYIILDKTNNQILFLGEFSEAKA